MPATIARKLGPLRNQLADKLLTSARRIATDHGWAHQMAQLGAPSMLGGLHGIRDLGFTPMRIVDGGACRGDWTRLARQVFPDARILMIEPQTQHAATLSQLCESLAPGVSFAPSLIGPAEKAAVDFYVLINASGGTGSSVLSENSDVPRRVVTMPMVTLDQLVESTGFGLPDFIKLDVQGYELAVLDGAERCLRTADLVLLEVSFWRYNEGGPLAAEVVSSMDARGFVAFEVFELSRRPHDGILVQMDMLFLRKSHPLLDNVQTRFRS